MKRLASWLVPRNKLHFDGIQQFELLVNVTRFCLYCFRYVKAIIKNNRKLVFHNVTKRYNFANFYFWMPVRRNGGYLLPLATAYSSLVKNHIFNIFGLAVETKVFSIITLLRHSYKLIIYSESSFYWKCFYFDSIFIEICSRWSNLKCIVIGLGNGLVTSHYLI